MDWNVILAQVLTVLILSVVPALAILVGRLIVSAIQNSKNTADDRLASLAVAWAEDYFGEGKGKEKLDAATARVVGLSGGLITMDQADILVRGAYQGLMGELSKLKN